MLKRVSVIFLLFFICLVSAHAQDHYRSGFVITMSNDTLKGLVNDKETAQSPQTIQFKENESAAPKTYTTADIKGFATSRGVYFESKHFQYDGDLGTATLTPERYLTSRSPQNWSTTDCFVEVIVKGQFSLFKYQDANNRIHFLILDEGKTELEELIHRTFITSNSTKLMVNDSYKQQLLLRCEAKCPDLKTRMINLAYREQNLGQMVTSMNECYGSVQKINIVVADDTERKASKIGLVAEVYVTDPAFYTTPGGYDAVQFAGGVSYEVFSKKRPNRLSFYSELKLKNFSNVDDYYTNAFFPRTGKLTYKTVKLTNTVRLYATKPKTLYFNAGVVYGYRFNTTLEGKEVTDRHASDRFEFGFAAGLGKKFTPIGLSIETRFELNVPMEQKSLALIIGKQF